jgi:hypothetical protein
MPEQQLPRHGILLRTTSAKAHRPRKDNTMADVTFTRSCVNADPITRTCHLTGNPCPLAPEREHECADCRYLAKVTCPPDEFHILVDADNHPKPGRFALKRCRDIEIHEAAGVHISNLLACETPRSLLHATRLTPDTVNFTTPEDATLRWTNGRFIPA